jgi:hypothetical protein
VAGQVIVVTTRVEDELAEGPEVWSTLAVTLTAALAHAPGVPIVVAWEGPVPPGALSLVPSHERLSFVERPPFLSRSQAFRWLVDGASIDGDVVWLADDVTIDAATLPTLLADASTIRASQPGMALGFVVCRADHAPLPQQVGATDPSQVIAVNRCELNCAVVPAEVVQILVPVWHDDLGDEVMGFDLSFAGFKHFVSRAVVRRPPGARVTTWGPGGQVPPDAATMLSYIRPDIVDALVGVPQGVPAPLRSDELADPAAALRAWRAQEPGPDAAFGSARCLRALGRPMEAAAALGDFDIAAVTVDDARFVADLARLVGDVDTALDIYAARPELADEHTALTTLIAAAPPRAIAWTRPT